MEQKPVKNGDQFREYVTPENVGRFIAFLILFPAFALGIATYCYFLLICISGSFLTILEPICGYLECMEWYTDLYTGIENLLLP